MNIALRRFLHNHDNIATEGSPNSLEHRIYMHNHDDNDPSRPGFESGTPRLQAPVDTNEPSGPALLTSNPFRSVQTPFC